MKIAYICDGLMLKCSDKIGCFRTAWPGMDYCTHTFDPSHAKNGACTDPQNCPDRFHEIDLTDEETCYWEGEVQIPQP